MTICVGWFGMAAHNFDSLLPYLHKTTIVGKHPVADDYFKIFWNPDDFRWISCTPFRQWSSIKAKFFRRFPEVYCFFLKFVQQGVTGGYDASALRPSGVGMRCRMRAAAMRRQDTLTSTCSNAQKCTNKRVLSGKEWGKPNKPSVMKGLFHSHLYNDFLALLQVCLTEVLPSSKRLILDIQKCDKPNQKPGTIPNMFFSPTLCQNRDISTVSTVSYTK